MESLSRPELSIMVISVTPPALPMAEPFAVEPVKLIVPKSASGRIPPPAVQHGASTMTSADDRAGVEVRLAFVVWLQPWVVSAMYRLKFRPPVQVTVALKWSPARTVLE